MTRILHLVAAVALCGVCAASLRAADGDAADWRSDAPGRVHRVDLDTLPRPYASASSGNAPRVVPRPDNAALSVPPNFRVEVFAGGLHGPRKILVAGNGDVLISETAAGRITVIHPNRDGTTAASTDTYAQGLNLPFGLAFYPDSVRPRWLYVAESNRVIRYPYGSDRTATRAEPETVVPSLPAGGAHGTRDIAFSADGRWLFVSVGSASNVAESMSKKTPEAARRWESLHGLGAAWDAETGRADVLVFDAAAPAAPKTYATGLRNCVSLTVEPVTGALWCTTNERDLLGDDLVPDYSTRVREGGFYGWPWYYLGSNPDPRLAGERPDLAGKAEIPDILYQAHSAALNLLFYRASSGASAFPPDYAGDAFVALHGSWNRSQRTGYKLVRARMRNGVPTGTYEDFLTGFVIDDRTVWGRPVAVAELADGSLLLSDDAGNTVFRISHRP